MPRSLEPVTLVGEHVRLEPLTRAHASGLAAAAASGPRDTYAFTAVPDGEESAARYVDAALALHAQGTALPFATVDAASGRVVGSTRYLNVEFWAWPAGNPFQRGEDLPDVVEIGSTWLAPAAQRTPINTEAKLLMLTHAFETWRVHRVTLKTDARNERSRAAILRLGATFEGVIRAQMIAYDGGIRDTAWYSILDSEWPAVKAGLATKLRS
ncbi:MAG: GNAT family N-acetyltransferase [Candidatus Rokubacteria bacterium]|nr:GNAT family N-acetyltransferase [Candidatus Rokubacteria bacterium]